MRAPTTNEINDLIQNRKLFRGFDDNTYGNQKLFEEFGRKRDLKWIKLIVRYKGKYKWTDEQCEEMLAKCPDSWTHNGITYLYDWGCGKNKVITQFFEEYQDLHDMHEPQLDHIIPRHHGGQDVPENMQVVPALVNRIKNNLRNETWTIVRDILDKHFQSEVSCISE